MARQTFFFLFIALILLWLLPLWIFEFLPFVDFPQHLAIAHIVHNYHNSQTPIYSHFFRLKFFPKVHILHTLFLHWMSFLVPIEIAGKLFLSLIVILLPISIYQFIKAQGGNPWFSLFSFFFIYNFNLMWGFIAFCLGIPIFFYTLSLLLQRIEIEDTRRGLIMDVGLFLLLILTLLLHALSYFLLLLTFLITLCFLNQGNWKKVKFSLSCALVSFVFFLFCSYPVWLRTKTTVLQHISTFIPSLTSIQLRLLKLPRHLFSGQPTDKAFFWFVASTFFVLFLLQLKQNIKVKKFNWNRKVKVVYLLTIIFIILYLFMPRDITGLVNIVGPRFAIFIPLLLIGPLSRSKLNRLIPRVIGLTLVILILLLTTLISGFHKFNVQAKPVKVLLEQTERNKRLVELYTYPPAASPFYFHSFLHFSCYYIIWKNGLSGFIFPQSFKYHIIEIKEEVSLPTINVFGAWKSIFPQGWKNFDYFLVCGKPALGNEFWLQDTDKLRLLAQEGIWRLYTRR